MNVKFYKNCENTGKIRKISCVIYFLGLSREIFFGVISDN